jgi:hypothetical protein
MLMNRKLQITAKVIVFLMIFCLIFSYVSGVFSPKWARQFDTTSRITTFYQQPKDSIDVLFLGASSYRQGISPLLLWEEYGFTSYVLASSLQSPAVTYYYLLEALKNQRPKVVVLDGITLMDSYDVDVREDNLRQSIDPMNLSVEKVELALDIVSQSKKQSFASYMFPFFRYHTRWKELGQVDFEYFKIDRYDRFRGVDVQYQTVPFDFPEDFMKPTNVIRKYNDNAVDYYAKIIQLCQKNNIQVLLITLPRLNWIYPKYFGVEQFAEKYNIPHIDYTLPQKDNQFGFNPAADFFDPGHLNINGIQKYSPRVGSYLKKMCDLPDKRGNPAYKQWDIDLQYFKDQINQAKQQTPENKQDTSAQ